MNVDLVWDRFVHRSDVYARQWVNGDKAGYSRQTEGECPNTPKCPKATCPHIKDVPLTKTILEQHIAGKVTVSAYQLTDDNTVKWLCFDVDIQKNTDLHADQAKFFVQKQTKAVAQKMYKLFGPNTFRVEQSGSKGYHVWVFFTEPIQARDAHVLGNWIRGELPTIPGIEIEVFPKQTTLTRYGNMVKLPFSVNMKTGVRCWFVDNRFEPYEDQEAALESVVTIDEAQVLHAFEKHKISRLSSIIRDREVATKGSLPCMFNMMQDGLREGSRDLGMVRLAVYLKDKGLPVWANEVVLHGVNDRTEPPMDDVTIQQKLESAMLHDYSIFGQCGDSQLDSFCSSSCNFWEGKVRNRWSIYGKDPKKAVGVISRD